MLSSRADQPLVAIREFLPSDLEDSAIFAAVEGEVTLVEATDRRIASAQPSWWSRLSSPKRSASPGGE
jgi:hypothetical protein